MTRLDWDPFVRSYESGVDQGVLYLANGLGIAWNGLVSVKENPDVAVDATVYFDGNRNVSLQKTEDFSATIEAITYPDGFEEYDGYVDDLLANQVRTTFNFAYRTIKGDGYEIHLIYNALASPSTKNRESLNDSVKPLTFVWDITTVPEAILGTKPSSHLIVDTLEADPDGVQLLVDYIYGTNTTPALFPTVQEVLSMINVNSIFDVVDNGDGTWTATGSDEAIQMLDPETFQITWPLGVYIDRDSYTVNTSWG